MAGDPDDPMVFYFGGCAGSVWKTVDGGVYWRCTTDGYFGSAAVGALAVARSDRNVIYAGMGETTIRLDVSYGDGLYKSDDAGRSWRHVGLGDTKHIGEICIHPANPDVVHVAALGDIFGPHEARGVYRTRDGGATWEHVLAHGPDAGAVDISMDPGNPRILFAAFWQARRSFWNLSSGGPGSGLFRSTDGGDTWEDISRAPGLPDGMLGKIGVAVSPARGPRLGAGRAYVGCVELSAHHPDTVYVAATRYKLADYRPYLFRSRDGGRSWAELAASAPRMATQRQRPGAGLIRHPDKGVHAPSHRPAPWPA